MALVFDFYPEEKPLQSENDNLTQIELLTRDIIGVQYHSLGNGSLRLENQINRYARDTMALLNALGVNRKKLKDLLEIEFDKESLNIDEAFGRASVSMLSLSSTLCVDVNQEIRNSLKDIIEDVNRPNIEVDITQ